MRITIDTKEDSREEIKRIIHFLSTLLGDGTAIAVNKDIFGDNKPIGNSGNAFTALFGDSASTTSPPIDSNSIKEEGEKEEAKLQFFY